MGTNDYQSFAEGVQGDMTKHLVREIKAMIEWTLTNGMEMPSEPAERFYEILSELRDGSDNTDHSHILQSNQIADLVVIHATLTEIIHPAKPRTVALMYHQRHYVRISNMLGPIPIIRHLVLMAIAFISVMYGMSYFEDVTIENINLSILDQNSNGLTQLKNQAFLLACAGLGSVFSCLFLSMRYVTRGTYDPKYNASYWVRIILGLIAGLIMVELIPESLFKQGEASIMGQFGKPTTALLGGFSATVVHKLLQKIVDILSSMIDQLPGGKDKPTESTETAMEPPAVANAPVLSPWEKRAQALEAQQKHAEQSKENTVATANETPPAADAPAPVVTPSIATPAVNIKGDKKVASHKNV